MKKPLEDLDLKLFWENSKYSEKEYVGCPVTQILIKEVEKEIGLKLPASYLTLLESQNGGIPKNRNFPLSKVKSISDECISISGIFGIDSSKKNSILGANGNEFMISTWGYPDIGIYICNCPSAGHDMVGLDYRECGRKGEPKVVYVDQENDYRITFLTSNFEEFIYGLVTDEYFKDEESDNIQPLWKPDKIKFQIIEGYHKDFMLELKQTLSKGEFGWTGSRISIPKKWKNASLSMKDKRIHIFVNGKTYYLDRENQGQLQFEILNAGEISDKELERIWSKYAR
ncbi:MAG: SMI1/KNR4 family protein [Leptospiraceae bacterium]|nr:SMI1/KNR4 family protein [Leptospiraceae bacterium]